MPVTPKERRRAYVTTSTIERLGSLSLISHILLASLLIATTATTITTVAASTTTDQQDAIDETSTIMTVGLPELLHTETVLIEQLRAYIQTLQNQIELIKRKTLEIKAINDVAMNATEKYVNNPLNAITILKRFTADWKILRKYAEETFTSEAQVVERIGEDIKSLIFPSDEDFDDAAVNLLRIQDIYKLPPERLAVGEMNGIKLGSEMSWSDCLEIGRKSHQNGDYMLAKFWMETALGKLPAVNNDTKVEKTPAFFDNEKGKFEIMETLIEMEYDSGNTQEALEFVNELLAIKPTHKRLKDVRSQIENAIKKEKSNRKAKHFEQPKSPKLVEKKFSTSTEELLIAEICRNSAIATGTSVSSLPLGKQRHCSLEWGNAPHLLLQPLKIEYISIDPYIVIYHDVLNAKEMANLNNFIEESENENDDVVNEIKFTAIGMKKLQLINNRLQTLIGYSADLYEPWQITKRDFETLFDTETLTPQWTTKQTKLAANALFNLQPAKIGGAIGFPQLELSVHVPKLSVLYWSHLNEFHDYDYRTKQHVCPIVAGTQISVYTSIKYVI